MVTKRKTGDMLDERGFHKTTSFDWMCLSTDEKPKNGANINEILLELDTGKGFHFNGSEWEPIGG